MDYLKQFRLLFHQRLLLRRRQSTIFCLELFWPAIVFFCVFLTRFNFPPNYKDTCTYTHKALPSAGALNFIQSFVCTLDNPCLNDTINEEINRFPQARIHKLVDHLNPLFDQRYTGDRLAKLPKGISLIETVVQTLSEPTLRKFIEDGVQLKDILRDQTALTSLTDYIRDSLKESSKLSDQQVDRAIDALYHSSLNVVQLVQTFKSNNFRYSPEQYACSEDALSDLLRPSESDRELKIGNETGSNSTDSNLTDSNLIGNATGQNETNNSTNGNATNSLDNRRNALTVKLLCELSAQGRLEGLLQLTQKSIDLVKVLNWMRTLMRMLKLNEQHLHLGNLMHMLTTVEQRDMLSPTHHWSHVSDHLQTRLSTLVRHIDHSKNGFVISLERLTQQTTLDSLSATIGQIESELVQSGENAQLAQALKVITIGLKSLEYFKNQGLFEVKYKFQELIRNVDSIRMVMESQLHLEPALIDIILGSSFDFTETVASEQVDPFLLCNHEALRSIIQFTDNDELLGDYNQKAIFDVTANAICVLSTSEGYLFSDRILRTFAIKKIVNNMLEIIANGVLENRNINRYEVPNALSGLRTATASMSKVKPFIDRFTELLDLGDQNLDLNTNGNAIDLLSSSKTGLVVGKLMCGKDLPAIKDELHLLKSSSSKSPKIDQNELAGLRSEFCKNGYLQIMQMRGGPLIWTWLKPILSGKVLYTPKNQATDQIIHEINSTFTSLESLISSLRSWTETAQSLRSFFSDKQIQRKIVDVQQFLPLVLGQGYEHLFDDNETVYLIESLAKSSGIINLIELFGNVAQCIEMNRFIGYDTEFQLEQAAKRYTKSHNLIAGIVFLNLDNHRYGQFADDGRPRPGVALPKRIKYKLRVDIDFVPSTKMLKDRIWEPGSKAHFDKDLGYFKGFTQLQEMIDHAIMKVQLFEISRRQHANNSSSATNSIESENFNSDYDEHPLKPATLELPSVYMQQMPYACYREDKFGFYILALSPVISTVAWIFLIAFSIRDYVLERELHLEEVLYVTGLKPSVRFLIWFIMAFLIMAFGCACGLAIFRLADIIPNSDFLLVYLYFLAFCFSIVMYCYMISSFFSTATIASLSGIIVYLASYLPFMVCITFEHELTLLSKLASCMSMSTAMCFGIMYLARFESQGVGVQWDNVYQSPMAEDTMNFGYALQAMLVDGLLYFLIGWYFSNVLASTNYGRKSFYFFLQPSYWGLNCFCSDSVGSKDFKSEKIANHRGIIVHNLCVTYNQGDKQREHQAVRGLTMSLEEGQIATLLGKNGAGKTSTISVLTAILKPTSGQVYIYGEEFLKNFERTRKLLGYCPQYNVLFDRMTVREHLDFFARLKNLLPERAIKADVECMLQACCLTEVKDQLAMNLSGGLQRRLCVACAFIGGSKMIILDEPTASVDPYARRAIWNLIVSQKATRTVLLTTHHMDEADILSDNVAIIHKGALLCQGSPLLLKSKFGCGYQLTISRFGDSTSNNSSFKNTDENIKILVTDYDQEAARDEETALDQLNVTDSDSGRVSNNSVHLNNLINTGKRDELNCSDSQSSAASGKSSDKLMQFIQCLVPNALKLDENLNEMIVALPRTGADGAKHDYSTFFQVLDSNISRFGYHSYGLTSTTLEEVFLTLCSLQDSRLDFVGSLENKLNLAKKINLSINSFYGSAPADGGEFDYFSNDPQHFGGVKSTKSPGLLCTGLKLKIMQFKGLIKKRAYHTFTNRRTLFYNLVFPCIFIFFAMGMTTIKPKLAPDPILPLSPAIYGSEATSFFAFKKLGGMPAGQLEREMNSTTTSFLLGNGASPELDCAEPRKGWKVAKCPVIRKSFKTQFPQYLLNFSSAANSAECTCERCFDYEGQVDQPIATSLGYVYDLSNVSNINHFLMRTFSLFNERRYGGWSLHQVDESVVGSINSTVSSTREEVWKIWFDNNGIHAIPSYLNALNNALFRANLIKVGGLSEQQALDYSISSYSHPFHIRSAQLGDQNLMQKAGDSGIALIILVGFVFIPTSFVFYIVKERKNEEKHMQRIYGVGTTLYWTVSIVWDMTIVFFSVLVAGAIIWSFQMPIYVSRLNFPAIVLLLLLFGWAMISVVYILEKFFDESSIAFMVIYSLSLFVGINTMVFRLLIDVFNLLQVSPIFKATFERVALLFPPFALMSGLVDVTKNHLLSEMFQLVGQDVYVNPFSMELLVPHYITLGVEGVLLFIVNLLIELVRNGDLWFMNRYSKMNANELLSALDPEENGHYASVYDPNRTTNGGKVNLAFEEDQDVFEERKRIITNELASNLGAANNHPYHIGSNDVLKVVNVSKRFNSSVSGRKDKLVVDRISFGVPPGECFGLLGTNGAGKTSLFRILTGQISPSSGTTMFNQQKVEQVLAGTCKILGYCPQTDALDSTLTPRQHLAIYSLMRGIRHSQREQVIKESLRKFQLSQYEHFAVHSLSRGTKRKLCLAISMLGDPQIVLLDEPTSGMDPLSRRCLLQNIQQVIKEQRSVLITSHSMEECDTLCSRIAIMVNGRFSCLGSPQYLKRKYGYGYTITLRLNENMMNCERAIEFIKKHFPSILLRAHHHNMLEFSLPTNDILLSKIFAILDTAKATLNLQDYTISQTTLDQVFVNFASQEGRDSILDGSNGTAGMKHIDDGQLPHLNGRTIEGQTHLNGQLPHLNGRILDGQLPHLNGRTIDAQLPQVNGQMAYLNGRINETRFNETNVASRTANDELMQQSPSNLIKCSSVYRTAESGQLRSIDPKLAAIRHLPGPHRLSARAGKKSSRQLRLKQPVNFNFANQVALNNQINLSSQTNGPSATLYYNRPPPPHASIAAAANFGGLAYPLNYLHSSNLYCSIGRPPNASSAHLYSSASVQQPKWKFKQKFSMD